MPEQPMRDRQNAGNSRSSGCINPGVTKPLALRFEDEDTLLSVSRSTLLDMATKLHFSEEQTIHLALARLRDELMPRYAQDDGPSSMEMLEFLRRAESQDGYKPTSTLIRGL